MSAYDNRVKLTAAALNALILNDGGLFTVPSTELGKKAVELADAAIAALNKKAEPFTIKTRPGAIP